MNSPSLIRVFYPPYDNGDVYTLSPLGRKYSEDTLLLSREDRSASGLLRRDIIASKKTFTLSYDAIDDAALWMFEDIYKKYSGAELTLEVTHIDNVRQFAVLIKAFSKQRVLAMRGGLWGSVTIEFEEI